MSFLEQEIHEQPAILRNLLTAEADHMQEIAQAVRDFDPAFVMIAARGTSDNAARYAQYSLGIAAQLPVALGAPSIHTLYGAQPNMSRALVIGVSQSGESVDVAQIVQDARLQGALTLTITNQENSLMAKAAHHHIWLRCGEEKSVAATKTYTAQLVAVAMLTQAIVGDAQMLTELQRLPDWVEETLTLGAHIGEWVQRYRYMERIALIGRGYNYCTAFEIALKIKELAYVTGEEYSEADFRHGPIAIISQGFPVMVVAPTGKTLPLMRDLLEKLGQRNAECIVISDDVEARKQGISSASLPVGIPEWLSPIPAVVPGQLFAYNLALVKGNSIDQPRGLTKVTITR